MIHEQLMSRNEIQSFVNMDNLETLREQLCATLNSQLASIVKNISMPQLSLSQALQQHSTSNVNLKEN